MAETGAESSTGGPDGGSSDDDGSSGTGGTDPDSGSDDTETGASDVELGDLGLIVDVRESARIGRPADVVAVDLPEPFDAFDADIDVDALSDFAVLRIAWEELDEGQRAALERPIDVVVEARSEENTLVGTRVQSVRLVDVETVVVHPSRKLEPVVQPFAAMQEADYFIQARANDELLTSGTADGLASAVSSLGVDGDAGHQRLRFASVAGGYQIQAPSNDLCLQTWDVHDDGTTATAFYWIRLAPCDAKNQGQVFAIEPTTQGFARLRSVWADRDIYRVAADVPAGQLDIPIYEGDYGAWADESEAPSGAALEFRIVAVDAVYTVVDEGTTFSDPLIPPGRIDFAYDQTIENCSPAGYVETVGKAETWTSTRGLETQESLQLYASEGGSVGVTAGVSAGFSAFGANVTASLEVSAGFEFSTSSTETSTETVSVEEIEEVEVSRVREITVGAYQRIQVRDAVHVIDNVRVPFVQSLRIEAVTAEGASYPGDVLQSLLAANQFGGVVADVGPTSVTVTIRGEIAVDELHETTTLLDDLGSCSR